MNRVLRKIFSLTGTREYGSDEKRGLCSVRVTISALYSSPNIIRVIEINGMGGACGTFGGQDRCIEGFCGKTRW